MSLKKQMQEVGNKARDFVKNDENIARVSIEFRYTEATEKYFAFYVFWKFRKPENQHIKKIINYSGAHNLPYWVKECPRKDVFS